MKVTDVRPTGSDFTPPIPDPGYYAALHYMYGDADGYNDVVAGPFPYGQKHLFIEFLNVLEGMLSAYPEGKGGFDGYGHVPNYAKWFNEEDEDEEDEDGEPQDDEPLWVSLGLETECAPDDTGCVASLMGYECWSHDGESYARRMLSVV